MSWALLWALTAQAQIEVQGPLIPGEEVLIELHDAEGRPRAGETVRVVHRPGLRGERELAIGITDSRGAVRWTPAASGVARLRAGDEVLPIRVQPTEAPTHILALLLVMALAGLGGLSYGLAPVRRRGAPSPPPRRTP